MDNRLIYNNKFILFCLGFVVFHVAAYLFPTSYWYELHRIKIQDSFVGKPIIMVVDRSINRPFIGHRNVSVRKVDAGVTDIICTGMSVKDYRPNTELPEQLTLSWWMGDSECKLAPGFYVATTIIHIDVANFLQPKSIINESNIFEIKL